VFLEQKVLREEQAKHSFDDAKAMTRKMIQRGSRGGVVIPNDRIDFRSVTFIRPVGLPIAASNTCTSIAACCSVGVN
jgi:hypothetical protein